MTLAHSSRPATTSWRAQILLPFRALAAMPWAMTAHIVYIGFDPTAPATLSRRVIAEIIRGEIGFDGVLVSDDLSMRALGGRIGERARRALAAGCDLVLHCNGDPGEMEEVVAAAGPISAAAPRRGFGAARRCALARAGNGVRSERSRGAIRCAPRGRANFGACGAVNPAGGLAAMIYQASTWVLPVIFAVTFHEAAHGFVAYQFGDDTAWRAGRVTFNPLKHVDPFGTIILPAMLILLRSPFLFGYAKPVPVNFRRLDRPRRDMVWVALAGPGTNVLLAIVSSLLFYGVAFMPPSPAEWLAENLVHSIQINAVLCVFNMLPLPPLDGGRVAVGLLPDSLALPLARLERYGMLILLLFLFVIPYVGEQTGHDLNILAWLIGAPTEALIRFVLTITGQGG